jgi:[FeFe] hydrogenase H-cluster maturation GTPase HydF
MPSDNLIKVYEKELDSAIIKASAIANIGMDDLKEAIIKELPDDENRFKIVGDLIDPGDFVVLVVPIDKSAPKGRLILPQQQVIRDILESDAMVIVTKEYELKETLENIGKKPKLVITDSQVFSKVSADTPKDIWLTSFSILFARYKGDLGELVNGALALDNLNDNDTILVAEGCTHHAQADDIATVKIPRWIRQYTGKKINFEYASGMKYPNNIEDYALIVHCGGCMLNKREVMYRIDTAKSHHVPIVNYGVLIACVQGILKRTLDPFPQYRLKLEAKE